MEEYWQLIFNRDNKSAVTIIRYMHFDTLSIYHINDQVYLKREDNMKSRQTNTDKIQSKTAMIFEAMVDASGMKQREIAERLGYDKPNIITMMKQGLTKIPIYKIPKIAKLFNIDAAELLKTAMMEYEPDKYMAIVEILGDPITGYERQLLQVIREEVNNTELQYNVAHYCAKIRACLKSS
jgi:predicted XRE-type DNA-binding protein